MQPNVVNQPCLPCTDAPYILLSLLLGKLILRVSQVWIDPGCLGPAPKLKLILLPWSPKPLETLDKTQQKAPNFKFKLSLSYRFNC